MTVMTCDITLGPNCPCLRCVIWRAVRDRGQQLDAREMLGAIAGVAGEVLARVPPEERRKAVFSFGRAVAVSVTMEAADDVRPPGAKPQ